MKEIRENDQSDNKRFQLGFTLKGSLSVLKAIPGTYFSQTGNPLKLEKKKKTEQKTEYMNRMNDNK